MIIVALINLGILFICFSLNMTLDQLIHTASGLVGGSMILMAVGKIIDIVASTEKV